MRIIVLTFVCGLLFAAAHATEPEPKSSPRREARTPKDAEPEKGSRRPWFGRKNPEAQTPPAERKMPDPLTSGPVEQSRPQQTQKPKPGQARLRLHGSSHNFGDVARKGGDLVCDFVFTNEGTAPLVLTRVITSCSCLKADYSKRPVAPGARGVIHITYEPHKSEPGVFNKVIHIYSNSADGRELITVQGNSIPENTVPRKRADKE